MDLKQPTDEELLEFLRQKYYEEQLEKIKEDLNQGMVDSRSRLTAKMQEITPEIFSQFLMEVGVNFFCPSCHSGKLSIPERAHLVDSPKKEPHESSPELNHQPRMVDRMLKKYAAYVTLGDEPKRSPMIRSYFMVHCDDCGYLSLYRAIRVLRWVEEMEGKEGAGRDESENV